MLQDFKSVSDHFGTLCIKGLRIKFEKSFKKLIFILKNWKQKIDVNLSLYILYFSFHPHMMMFFL